MDVNRLRAVLSRHSGKLQTKGQVSDMKRWRHLIVAIGLVPAISIYVMTCLYFSGFIVGLHWASDLGFFVCAGLAWIYPAAIVIHWLAVHEG